MTVMVRKSSMMATVAECGADINLDINCQNQERFENMLQIRWIQSHDTG